MKSKSNEYSIDNTLYEYYDSKSTCKPGRKITGDSGKVTIKVRNKKRQLKQEGAPAF